MKLYMEERVRFFKNNVQSDIYLGRGAGKKIMQDILNAKWSVKVISPFLSPIYIERLIESKHRGIDVKLITTDEIEDYKAHNSKKLIYELIKQFKYTDENAFNKREKLKILNKRITWSWIILMILSNVLAIITKNNSFFIGLFFVFLLIITTIVINSKIRNTRIYNYTYQTLFPFKVFLSPQNNNMKRLSNYYIHSKLFIIDDSIAYLGSINYTRSGMEFNFESRIRITNQETIHGLNKMFFELYEDEENYFWDINSWGKKIYREPIN